jgi:hypothetical protein
MSNHAKRGETGIRGAQFVADELVSRGYKALIMPPYNRGFDISCVSPKGKPFRVEVKCSTSIGTQVPLQIKSHLEAALQRDLVYVFVRPPEGPSASPEFCVMTHAEIHAAWAKMPRIKPDGTPYVIKGTGYIDWKHINPHRSGWNKLPN